MEYSPSGAISAQPQPMAIINMIKCQHWKKNLCVKCRKKTKQPMELQPSCVIHLAQEKCYRNAVTRLARSRAPSDCPDKMWDVHAHRQIGWHASVNNQKYFSILFCKCALNIFIILSHIFISYKPTESTSSCSTANWQ